MDQDENRSAEGVYMRLLPNVTLGELLPAAYQWETSTRTTGIGESVKACIPTLRQTKEGCRTSTAGVNKETGKLS